jgi:hypothetical protein
MTVHVGLPLRSTVLPRVSPLPGIEVEAGPLRIGTGTYSYSPEWTLLTEELLDHRPMQGLADRSHGSEGQYRVYRVCGTDQFQVTCHHPFLRRGTGTGHFPREPLHAIRRTR